MRGSWQCSSVMARLHSLFHTLGNFAFPSPLAGYFQQDDALGAEGYRTILCYPQASAQRRLMDSPTLWTAGNIPR